MDLRKPEDFLCSERFDVLARTAFVRGEINGYGLAWGRSVYKDFILSTAKDRRGNAEWGEDNKKFSYADYEKYFKNLIGSISENGFVADFGGVPVSNRVLINGAHRVATSLILRNSVPIEDLGPVQIPNYDYRWLIQSGMQSQHLDQIALDFVRLDKNTRVLVFFGHQEKLMDEIFKSQEREKLNKVIYNRKISLSPIGMRRIIQVCYQMNDWWQDSLIEKMYLERFFGRSSHIYLTIVQSINHEEFISYKNYLREEFNPREFPRIIHGSDRHEDTFEILSTLLNRNGLNFLNNSKVGSEFRIMEILNEEGSVLASENCVIDGSASLEFFGGKLANDIDFITLKEVDYTKVQSKKFDNHEKFYDMLPIDFRELIVDPRLHFCWGGYKFATTNMVNYLKSEWNLNSELNSTHNEIYVDSRGLARARKSKVNFYYGRFRIAISPIVPGFIKTAIRKIFLPKQ